MGFGTPSQMPQDSGRQARKSRKIQGPRQKNRTSGRPSAYICPGHICPGLYAWSIPICLGHLRECAQGPREASKEHLGPNGALPYARAMPGLCPVTASQLASLETSRPRLAREDQATSQPGSASQYMNIDHLKSIKTQGNTMKINEY